MTNNVVFIAAVAGFSALGFLAGRLSPGFGASQPTHVGIPEARAWGEGGSGAQRKHTAGRDTKPAHPLAEVSPLQPRPTANEADPIATMKSVMLLPDPLKRAEAWLDFIGRLDASQYGEVSYKMRQVYFGTCDAEHSMILGLWAKQDALGALDFGSLNFTGKQMVLRILASSDPEAAIRWAESNFNGARANPFMPSVISGLAPVDLPRATALLNSMPESNARDQALAVLLDHGPKMEPDAALKWSKTISDDKLRESAIERIADGLARSDPMDAADLLKASPGENSTRALGGVMLKMAEADLPSALSYLRGIQDQSMKASIFAGLVDNLGQKISPLAPASWRKIRNWQMIKFTRGSLSSRSRAIPDWERNRSPKSRTKVCAKYLTRTSCGHGSKLISRLPPHGQRNANFPRTFKK